MRTEVKVGLIVGLVAIAGGVIWLFSRPGDELGELPFDRAAMEEASEDDAALASDRDALLPEAEREGSSARARLSREPTTPPPPRRRTPTFPPPGEPESAAGEGIAGGPSAEEAEGRTPGDTVVEPSAGESPATEPDRPGRSANADEVIQPTGPGETPPPEVPAPRRRTGTGEPQPPPRKSYTIQPGDRLIDLAREEYGDGDLWKAIKEVNPGLDENRLQIGEKIEIPSREEALRLTRPAATAEASPAAQPQQRPGLRPATAGRATYVVGQGDSLIKIARNVLQDGTRWQEIYELNRDQLVSPNLILPGMELKLPPLERKPAPEDNARG